MRYLETPPAMLDDKDFKHKVKFGILEGKSSRCHDFEHHLLQWKLFDVDISHYGSAASMLEDQTFLMLDAIFLSLDIPDTDTLRFIFLLRKIYDYRGIIIVNSQEHIEIIEDAIYAGADIFIHKLNKPDIIHAKLFSIFRRRGIYVSYETGTHNFGPYTINPENRVIAFFEERKYLTPTEYKLALLFFSNTSYLISRELILGSIWSLNDKSTRSLDTYVSRIRKKLSLNGEFGYRLSSVRSHGYILEVLI